VHTEARAIVAIVGMKDAEGFAQRDRFRNQSETRTEFRPVARTGFETG
jgi:hypothetical protein